MVAVGPQVETCGYLLASLTGRPEGGPGLLLAYHAPDAHLEGFRTVEVRVASPQGEERSARTIHGYYP